MPRPNTRPSSPAGRIFNDFFQSLKNAVGEPLSVHEFSLQIAWARRNESQISNWKVDHPMSAQAQQAVILAFPEFPLIPYRKALYDAASGSARRRMDAENTIGLVMAKAYLKASAELEQDYEFVPPIQQSLYSPKDDFDLELLADKVS